MMKKKLRNEHLFFNIIFILVKAFNSVLNQIFYSKKIPIKIPLIVTRHVTGYWSITHLGESKVLQYLSITRKFADRISHEVTNSS